MRGQRVRTRGVGLVVLIACNGSATGDGTEGDESTTVLIASFGEDTQTTTASTTGPTTTASPTTSASDVSTDPTVDPSVTADTTDTAPTSETSGTPTETSDGTEESSSTGEPWMPPPACAMVTATIRDFTIDHPDMSMPGGGSILAGLVLPTLDMMGVPQFNPEYAGEVSITSVDSFAQWYSDVPETNVRIDVELGVYEEAPGRVVFDGPGFLPIDGQGFGNEGRANNYYFTTAVHTELFYVGGEVMTFGGDDDVWVFIDGNLIADIGGQHAALYVDVALDDLGLMPGVAYSLDVFHAERGVGGSQLRFELGDFCD